MVTGSWQEGQEGRSWEQQAWQPHLIPVEVVLKILLESTSKHMNDKKEAGEQSALIYEGEIVFEQPGSIL